MENGHKKNEHDKTYSKVDADALLSEAMASIFNRETEEQNRKRFEASLQSIIDAPTDRSFSFSSQQSSMQILNLSGISNIDDIDMFIPTRDLPAQMTLDKVPSATSKSNICYSNQPLPAIEEKSQILSSQLTLKNEKQCSSSETKSRKSSIPSSDPKELQYKLSRASIQKHQKILARNDNQSESPFHQWVKSVRPLSEVEPPNPFADVSSFNVEDLYTPSVSMTESAVRDKSSAFQTFRTPVKENIEPISYTSTPKMQDKNFLHFSEESSSSKLESPDYLYTFLGKSDQNLNFSNGDFLNKEDAMDMIRKDEESFEEAHKFEIGVKDFLSQTYSEHTNNQFSLQSMLPESNVGEFSFGQFLAAYSEDMGTWSRDSSRKRPDWGTNVRSPKKAPLHSTAADVLQSSTNSEMVKNTISRSALSEAMGCPPSTDTTKVLTPSCSEQMASTFTASSGSSSAQNTVIHGSSQCSVGSSQFSSSCSQSQASTNFSQGSHPQFDMNSKSAFSSVSYQPYGVTTMSNTSGNPVFENAYQHHLVPNFNAVRPVLLNVVAQAPPFFTSNLVQMSAPPVIQQIPCNPALISNPVPGLLTPVSSSTEPSTTIVCMGVEHKKLITLDNKSDSIVYCHLKIIAFRDGCCIPVAEFSFPETVCIACKTILDVEIKFTPVQKGSVVAYVQIIQVLAMALGSNNSSHSVAEKLDFMVEEPVIQIMNSTEPYTRIKLTDVPEHGITKGYLVLKNYGQAAVPVCLTVSGQIEPHCLKFTSNSCNDEDKIIDTLACVVPGCSSKVSPIKMTVPIIFQAKCCKRDRDDIRGSIKATLDRTANRTTLASIDFEVSIGKIIIFLKGPVQNPLKLKYPIKPESQLILSNKGTIAASVALSIADAEDCISVSPPNVNIPPNGEGNIAVKFSPTGSDSVQGILHAKVKNGDNLILLRICGEFSSQKASGDTSKASHHGAAPCTSKILSNKQFLTYGCVNIGHSVKKNFSLKNPSADAVDVKLVVNTDHAFSILDSATNQGVSSLDFVLDPNAVSLLNVIFLPLEASTYKGHLEIYLNGKKNPSKIDLAGYGGTCKLKVLDLPSYENFGYHMILKDLDLKVSHQEMSVCNVGHRAAFVKISTKIDPLSGSANCFVEPSEFVVLEKETKAIQVTYCSTKDKPSTYQKNLGTILLKFGEEILRQNFKRCSRKSPSDVHSFDDANFEDTFLGEEKVSLDTLYRSSSEDVKLFRNCMKTLYVHLQMPEDSSNMTFAYLSILQNTTINRTVAETTAIGSPIGAALEAIEGNPTESAEPKAVPDSSKLKSFSVFPGSVTLDVHKKAAHLQLINFSSNELRFRVDYSATFICVSPVQGCVASRSSIGLRVNFVAYNPSTCSPEDAFIKVSSNNFEETIRVYINKCLMDIDPENVTILERTITSDKPNELYEVNKTLVKVKELPKAASLKSARSEPCLTEIGSIYPSVKVDKSIYPSQPEALMIESRSNETVLTHASESALSHISTGIPVLKKREPLTVECDVIEFPAVLPGKKSVGRFTLKNCSSVKIEVLVSGAKSPFELKFSEITVKARSSLKVPVSFCPKVGGSYKCSLILKWHNDKEININLEGVCQ